MSNSKLLFSRVQNNRNMLESPPVAILTKIFLLLFLLSKNLVGVIAKRKSTIDL